VIRRALGIKKTGGIQQNPVAMVNPEFRESLRFFHAIGFLLFGGKKFAENDFF
jgi:hypothetical protein